MDVVRDEHFVSPLLFLHQMSNEVHPLGVAGEVDLLFNLVVGVLDAKQVELTVGAGVGKLCQHAIVLDSPCKMAQCSII